MKNELFRISAAAWKALEPKSVLATVAALQELNLYHLPFERVDVAVDFSAAARVVDRMGNPVTVPHIDAELLFQNLSLNNFDAVKVTMIGKVPLDITGEVLELGMKKDEITREKFAAAIANALIALLATRNAVKERTENKLAKLNIGKVRWRYITRIDVPERLEDDEEHAPTGIKRCPHLRRGHIRRQHYGAERSLVKIIWIEPVFVNADETFVSSREAYTI